MLAYDPFVPAEAMAGDGICKTDLDTLLAQSDFVSLHLHLTPETRHIIDGTAIRKMKPSAILINVSRGGLVDDDALLAALRERRILAAGLDTHSREPLGSDSPFCALDNAVLTDHTAYYTREGVEELKIKSAKNVVCVLKGLPPPVSPGIPPMTLWSPPGTPGGDRFFREVGPPGGLTPAGGHGIVEKNW